MSLNDANAKFGTQAKVIEDSRGESGTRLTTMEVTLHRFVLAELNTHRVFSRNSASSRAIPFKKQVKRIRENPAVPVEWRAEQRGMQGGEELSENQAIAAEWHWLKARNQVLHHAEVLSEMGVHKSIVNRMLEPWMWHTVIISSTEWENFFTQRASELAQPEIRVAAELMEKEYRNSLPKAIKIGDWHLPYTDTSDWQALDALHMEQGYTFGERPNINFEGLKRISAARCARVSYLTHDGNRDIEKDLRLYDFLTNQDPPHWSPLEHVATPAKDSQPTWGNFDGWHQLRHIIAEQRGML